MVLFKRKPVQLLPEPEIDNEQVEVWQIPQTGEVFLSYGEYLDRMDFYKQKRFICQITGHSGLTFFQALESEQQGAQEIEEAFPEALKAPVLRRVQFSTISRIDSLVDVIFEEFKGDYYPGESVTVELQDKTRLNGVVRDKTRFNSRTNPDGTVEPAYSRYFVTLSGGPDSEQEAYVDEAHIWRDRRVFTKAALRSFIKRTVTRESWNGAPWLVKHEFATKYHIDTRVPPHLQYDNKVQERKYQLALKRLSEQGVDVNSQQNGLGAGPVRLPELKPAPKTQKGKQLPVLQQPQLHRFIPESGASPTAPLAPPNVPSGHGLQFPVPLRGNLAPPQPFRVFEPPPLPPPPPPKYPIEDLQLEPREGNVRPSLKFLCCDPPAGVDAPKPTGTVENIKMESVGPLLETWDTLNVYCEVFMLDSFTFDDFVEAMHIYSDSTPCELFTEIHCAVLKILVKSEADGGKVQIQLPELEEEEEEEEEEPEETEVPEPEPEPQPVGRATRSSIAKLEAERLAAEMAAAEKEREALEKEDKHRAAELLQDFDWIEQLQKREFANGGWEMIIVGLLYHLSKWERYTPRCEEILVYLVPLDVEPSRETVRQKYASSDINFRVKVLQIICMLTTETKAIRGYMEDCSEQMTAYRKEKIEHQKARKQAIEELKALQDQHKILLPDNMPPSPPPEEEEKEPNGDVKMADADSFRESPADAAAEDSDEDAHRGLRNLRRGQDRIEERKRKRVEEAERKREAELAAKQPKQSKQFIKLLKDIQKKEEFIKECEEEIAVIDNDLREADCPRTRVLGKDRFWNRYYWFERNGMPYGGLPDSSTAEAGYANGCIWVQGPYELEREGYIDVDMEYQREYKMKFKLTVPQRKKREEGATSLYTAYEWGYFDEPEQLDALIQWLDPRGFNELKLRKELVNFHDKIVQNMKNRRAYLKLDDEQKKADEANKGPDGAAKAEPTEEDKKPTINGRKPDSPPPLKRMSTRTSRALRQPTPPPPEAPPAQEQKYRCLKWHNLTAINELGHLHLEPPPPPAPQRGRKAAKKAAAAAAGRERRQEKVVEREPTPEPPPPRMMTRKALSRTNSARLR